MRDSKVARETGILGSLRWWYEGILRGFGGHACDPTEHVCLFDVKRYAEGRQRGLTGAALLAAAGLCPACQFFGATGWQRRFRLLVDGLAPHPLFFITTEAMYQATSFWLWRTFGGTDTGGERRGSRTNPDLSFGVQALWGQQATLCFIPFDPADTGVMDRLNFLMATISRYGGLGAKTQNGFGQIELLQPLEPASVARGKELILQDAQKSLDCHDADPSAFRLNTFFSRHYRIDQLNPYSDGSRLIGEPYGRYRDHYVPCAFDIRYKSSLRNPDTGEGENIGLRPAFREQWGREIGNELFGASGNQRSASRIHVSHLYRLQPGSPWELKIWGHLPLGLRTDGEEVLERDGVVETIDAFITGKEGIFPKSVVIDSYRQEEVLGHAI